MTNVFLKLEGKADELLLVNADNTMRCTRLIELGDIEPGMDIENNEIIDICITSTNMAKEHPKFDELLGKNMRITVETFDNENLKN